MNSGNSSKDILDHGLDRLEERLEPYDESNEISEWEDGAGLATAGIGYLLVNEATKHPEITDFMVQKPHYVLGGTGALVFTGLLNGGVSAYRKLASQANPLNVRDQFMDGYEKGKIDATVAEISEAWTPRSLEETQDLLEGHEFHPPEKDTREYLEDAEKAVGRQSRYGSPRRPQKLEDDEIEFFFHDIMKDVDSGSVQQAILEEPVGEDRYAFAAFWESKQGAHGDNEHCLFGYRSE